MKKAWAVPRPASAILQKTTWASIHHVSRLEPPEETLPILAVISVFDARCYANDPIEQAASQKAATVSIGKTWGFFTIWKALKLVSWKMFSLNATKELKGCYWC